MTPAELAALCAGVVPKGQGFMARCPAHDDHTPSLSIDPGITGVLLKCFAGCPTPTIVAALGLTMADLCPERASGPRVPVATYPYYDATGLLVYEVVRYTSPKTFRYRRPDPLRPGEWLWNIQGVPRVLYHLPQLLSSPLETPVYLVEGEKDVQTLEALGCLATTNPMGSDNGSGTKWLPAFTACLEARSVILLPDHDEAGEKHATYVSQQLHGVAAAVHVLRLPGLADKEDVTDWVHHGGTRQELDALVTSLMTPHALAVLRQTAEVARSELAWLWWPYLMRGALCMLDGDPGQGKSLLSLCLASTLSVGGMLPDQQGTLTVPAPYGTSLFFAAEDDVGAVTRPRLEYLGADLTRIYHFQGAQRTPGAPLQPFTLQDMDVLRDALEQIHPLLVVLDPIQAYFGSGVDMNRANETRQLLEPLAALAREYQCAMILVRHAAKGGGDGNGLAMMRGLGSVDLVAAARTALYVQEHPGNEHEALVCHSKSNASMRGRTLIFSKDKGEFAWAGVTRILGEDIAGSGRGPNPRERIEVALWLEKKLNDQFQFVTDLEMEAEVEGYSGAMLKKVKKMLKIKSKKMGFEESTWAWRLESLPIITQPPPSGYGSSSSSSSSTDSRDTRAPSHISIGYEDGVTMYAAETVENMNGKESQDVTF
jgi:hypothetical protein